MFNSEEIKQALKEEKEMFEKSKDIEEISDDERSALRNLLKDEFF